MRKLRAFDHFTAIVGKGREDAGTVEVSPGEVTIIPLGISHSVISIPPAEWRKNLEPAR